MVCWKEYIKLLHNENDIINEFYKIWKCLQDEIYNIEYNSSENQQDKIEKIKDIVLTSIEYTQEILKEIHNRRYRYIIIQIFLDWIIYTGIRWDIDIPKINIEKP